jgi:predicted TPR repeat methyltransferase
MLFERIRRTQKPVFIFLAVMFGLGFVALGVGSGSNGVNPLNFLSFGSSGTSISDLNSKVQKNPSDAASWLKLAQAYAQDQDTDKAILAYQRYTALRPKDEVNLGVLAGLYETRASATQQQVLAYQTVLSQLQQQAQAGPTSGLKLGKSQSSPLQTALEQPLQQQATTVSSKARTDFAAAMQLRQQLTKIAPDNSIYWFDLAQDAQFAQSFGTEVQALKQYLKLEPNAPNKKQLQRVIKQLAPLAASQSQQQTPATSTPAS